jgi:toxin ParE1/3/4
MTTPVYTSAARRDLVAILEYISADDPHAAIEWVEHIETRCLLLADSPTFGDPMPQLGTGVRATAVGRYVIYFRQREERTEILRVIPGDRNTSRL